MEAVQNILTRNIKIGGLHDHILNYMKKGLKSFYSIRLVLLQVHIYACGKAQPYVKHPYSKS